jgi:hypothetical protein
MLSCWLVLALAAPAALATEMVEVRQKTESTYDGTYRRPGRLRGPVMPKSESSIEQTIQILDADARVTEAVVDQISLLADDPDEMVELTLSYNGVLDASMWSQLEDLGGEVLQVFSSIDGC